MNKKFIKTVEQAFEINEAPSFDEQFNELKAEQTIHLQDALSNINAYSL